MLYDAPIGWATNRTVPDANVLPDAKQEQPKAATLFNNMTLIALTLCKGVCPVVMQRVRISRLTLRLF
jgi:hypothetical protein